MDAPQETATGARTPQSLCLSCGFCCDGTLFGRVRLTPGDALVPLQNAGLEIKEREESPEPRFQQPCAAHRQGCCQVYADRPVNCRTYRCALLKQYERDAISWTEAQQRIGRVRTLAETLDAALAHIRPGHVRMSVPSVRTMVPEHTALAADPELRDIWAPVLMRLAALLDDVHRHFQPARPGTAGHDKNP